MNDVWVIGANGQLGTYLTEVYGTRALGFTRETLDVSTDVRASLDEAAARATPRVIFNATAYNAVDRAETDRDACWRLNVDAPARLAAFAREVGADFYHYSTDFVYSGEGDQPWRESDPARPLSVYGESKLAGERAVLEANPLARVFRTSWVYAHRRANFILAILKRARETGHVSVVEDQVGSPTYARGLAELSAEVAGIPTDSPTAGVYHLADDGYVSRLELAKAALELATRFEPALATVTVTAVKTADVPAPARRPLNTRLDLTKVRETFGVRPAAWRDNLTRALRRHYEGH